MAWENLKSAVSAIITDNGNNEITGELLRNLLNVNVIEQLGAGFYKGIALPSTIPDTPQSEVYYIAIQGGLYSNFSGQSVNSGITILKYTGIGWTKEELLNLSVVTGGYGGTLQDLENTILAFNSTGALTYQTLVDLNAVTPVPPEGTPAKVANDPVSDNNGYYSVVSGSWVQDNIFGLSDTSELSNDGQDGSDRYIQEKEVHFKTKKAFKNLHESIYNCLQGEDEDYGIMLFGDSMSNYPSSHVLSAVSQLTRTYNGLGNAYYPTKTDYVNNKISYLVNQNGAVIYDVNQQNTNLGQAEWPGRVGYMDASGNTISFLKSGFIPTRNKTKIYILTDTVNTGTYDVEKTTDGGSNWVVELANESTGGSDRNLKIHVFDDTAESTSVGYRIVWKSGRVMCLDPLFIDEYSNSISHVTLAVGGSDFVLQCQAPKARVRTLIDDINIRLVMSSHRFEVADIAELNLSLDLLDQWWLGKNIDILYFGQPPQTNDNATADQFKRDINAALKEKAISQNYAYFDMYQAMGGLQEVIAKGWGTDPVHLQLKAYASISADVLNFIGLSNNIFSSEVIKEFVSKEIYLDASFRKGEPTLEIDNNNFDVTLRAKRYLNLTANDNDDPICVLDGGTAKHISVGDRLVFAHNGTKTVSAAAKATSPVFRRTSDTILTLSGHYGAGTMNTVLRLFTDPSNGKNAINIESGFYRSGTVPSTSTSAGQEGQIEVDANYIYTCHATNQWRRVALSTF